jgi:hypothetical protein
MIGVSLFWEDAEAKMKFLLFNNKDNSLSSFTVTNSAPTD